MAVPSLKQLSQLTLAQWVVKDGTDNLATQRQWRFLLAQLDHGTWGDESKSVLDRVVGYNSTRLTPEILTALLPLNAKSVCLSNCPLITEECINELINKSTQLNSIDFSDNSHLTLTSVNLFRLLLNPKHVQLTTVVLEDCTSVNDAQVQTLILNAPNLQHLNIARTAISDNVFLLDENKQLAREALLQLPPSARSYDSQLQYVDVSRCSAFTSMGVRHLCTLCGPSLRSVNFCWTKIDCTSLLYLAGYGLPEAIRFYLSCRYISQKTVDALMLSLEEFNSVFARIKVKWQVTESENQQSLQKDVLLSEVSTKDKEGDSNSCSACALDSLQTKAVHEKNSATVDTFPASEKLSSTDLLCSCAVKCACPNSLSPGEDQCLSSDLDLNHKSVQTNLLTKCQQCEKGCLDSYGSYILHNEGEDPNQKTTPVSSNNYENVKQSSFPHSSSPLEAPSRDNLQTEDFYPDQNTLRNQEDPTPGTCESNPSSQAISSSTSDVSLSWQPSSSTNDVSLSRQPTVCESDIICQFKSDDVDPADDCARVEDSPSAEKEGKLLFENVTNNNPLDDAPCQSANDEPQDAIAQLSNAVSKSSKEPFFIPNLQQLSVNGIIFQNEMMGLTCFQTLLINNKEMKTIKLYGGVTCNFVTDNVLSVIGQHCHQLTCLFLQGCDKVTDCGLVALKSCKLLSHVDFTGLAFIQDPGIFHLLANRDLTNLLLAESQITNICLGHMAAKPNITKLKELDLSWCEDIEEDEQLNCLLQACSGLEQLRLRVCPLTSATIQHIAHSCVNLTELSIASNMNTVLDDSVTILFQNLPLLEMVDLAWNTHLSDSSINCLLFNCKRLTVAHLEGLKKISSAPFLNIISVPDSLLTYLDDVQWNSKEADLENLPALPHRSNVYCVDLQELHLNYSDLVDDKHLEEIVTISMGSIKVVNYYGEDVEEIRHAWTRYIQNLTSK